MSETRPSMRRYWKGPHWETLMRVADGPMVHVAEVEPQRETLIRDLTAGGLLEVKGYRLILTRQGREMAFLVNEHRLAMMDIVSFVDPDPQGRMVLVPDWREFPDLDAIRGHAATFASELMYPRGKWMRRYETDKGRVLTQVVELTVVRRLIVWDTIHDHGEGQPPAKLLEVWTPQRQGGGFARWPDTAPKTMGELRVHPGPPLGDGPTEVRLRMNGETRLTTFARLFEELMVQHDEDREIVAARLRLQREHVDAILDGRSDLSDNGWIRAFRHLWPFHAITRMLGREEF